MKNLCPLCGRNLNIVGRAHHCVPLPGWVPPGAAVPTPPPEPLDPPEQGEAAFASAKQHRLKPKTHPRAKTSADLKRPAKKIEPASDFVKEAVAQFDAIQAERAGRPPGGDEAVAPSHPECARCEQIRRQTRDRVRASRSRRKRAAK